MKDKLVLKSVWNKTSQQFLLLKHKVDWNGRYETPAGKARRRETPQASAEEAPGPPAESKCLKWKSTSTLYKPYKKGRQRHYYRIYLQL
jgi:hypothetical protein